MNERINEWASVPWPQACKRQRILHRSPHPCPGREAFGLCLAEEAKEYQSGDKQQRWRPVESLSICRIFPLHSITVFLPLPGSHWIHEVSEALRKNSPGKKLGQSYPQKLDWLPPWEWGWREKEGIIQTKEYYTARKKRGILWKSKMKNSVCNMCRQKGRLYIHICSSMWKIIFSGNTGPLQKENQVARSK